MNTNTIQQQLPVNTILHGDCIEKMHEMPANSADFILTDPPYLVNYRDRDGRTIQNDANADWLKPAMHEAYRVLKMNRVAIMFYSWTKVDEFFGAWKDAGFQPVGHIVFRKTYSSKARFLSYQHEQAYLLAKGRPPLAAKPPVCSRRSVARNACSNRDHGLSVSFSLRSADIRNGLFHREDTDDVIAHAPEMRGRRINLFIRAGRWTLSILHLR